MHNIYPGQTFIAKTGSDTRKSMVHLYVVLTEPMDTITQKNCILWVSLSSVEGKRYYDDTCLLDVGDHPFISKKTWVSYQHAAITTADKIKKNLDRGLLLENDPLKEQLLNRILKGLEISNDTPREVLDFYNFYLSIS